MSIASLRKRAKAGTLEVEHLLREAAYPDPALADALDAMSAELQWHAVDDLESERLMVPLATWAEVVATYCRDGCDGLHRLATEPKLAGFVIGLLEEIRTNEALDTLLLAFRAHLNEPWQDGATSFRIAAAVNLMLSFKSAINVGMSQAKKLQSFLRALYRYAESDTQRATALLALRGIGDDSSAEFAACQRLGSPWEEVPTIVAKHIRKRL